ncbi:MAG: hypothetical protein GWM87_15800, partial [Xanthomonadales bacterium]|nr:hypothetical protein [Xanthomonadales bacterium]NIX14236.1 hypothetical protein [Xanthomonadales bacterium]
SRPALTLVFFVLFSIVSAPALPADRPHWNDIEVIRENTEPPRAHFIAYPGRELALARDTA